MRALLLSSLDFAVELISKTSTSTGLSVVVRVIEKLYESGRTVSDEFRSKMPELVQYDETFQS